MITWAVLDANDVELVRFDSWEEADAYLEYVAGDRVTSRHEVTA